SDAVGSYSIGWGIGGGACRRHHPDRVCTDPADRAAGAANGLANACSHRRQLREHNADVAPLVVIGASDPQRTVAHRTKARRGPAEDTQVPAGRPPTRNKLILALLRQPCGPQRVAKRLGERWCTIHACKLAAGAKGWMKFEHPR